MSDALSLDLSHCDRKHFHKKCSVLKKKRTSIPLSICPKISGSPSESTKEAEIDCVTKRQVTHAPAIAYHIRNAALVGGSIYAGNLRHFVFDESLAGSSPPVHVVRAGLASTFIGTKYFAHWLKDDYTQFFLAKQFGEPLILKTPVYPDATKYADYFEQNWSSPLDRAQIDHLVISGLRAESATKF